MDFWTYALVPVPDFWYRYQSAGTEPEEHASYVESCEDVTTFSIKIELDDENTDAGEENEFRITHKADEQRMEKFKRGLDLMLSWE